MIIAIDGPAGSGKSTICRLLARELGCVYLDTGAMYRAIAWALSQENISLGEQNGLEKKLASLSLHFALKDANLQITYKGKVLNEELRSPDMARKASEVSKFHVVREFLTQCQRRLAARGKVVAEGRDMTTVVFPHAPVKVFLTADLRTRAMRRCAEYADRGRPMEYSQVESQMRERDEADAGRALAPLKPAPDAFILDTSELDIHGVLRKLMRHVAEKTPACSKPCF